MRTAAGGGFCPHSAPGVDLPLPFCEGSPLEAEYCHLLALRLPEYHDCQGICPGLHPGCALHLSFVFPADARPAAPPVPQLAPQALCAIVQPSPDQFLRCGLDPFFQSVLHLGLFFDLIDVSHLDSAGRGQGPSLILLRGQVRGLGGHQFIELRMTGEIVHEGKRKI